MEVGKILKGSNSAQHCVANELFEVADRESESFLMVNLEKLLLEVEISLRRVGVLWQGFPCFCHVGIGELSGIEFLFGIGSDGTAHKECLE